jgi:hypothetical protein
MGSSDIISFPCLHKGNSSIRSNRRDRSPPFRACLSGVDHPATSLAAENYSQNSLESQTNQAGDWADHPLYIAHLTTGRCISQSGPGQLGSNYSYSHQA